MEIYKLKDEVPEKRRQKLKDEVPEERRQVSKARRVVGEGSVARNLVTDLRQGVKNPNRVNVYIDGEFVFSLDVAQVVDLGIKVGQVVTGEELDSYKRASEYGKLYQRTLEWVLARPRSVRETRDYLIRKLSKPSSGALASEEISGLSDEIISRLFSKGYLDDQKFAEWYVENRFVKKGVSRKRLKMELMKKGIDVGRVDEVLDGRDDESEIRKMIEKKRSKYDNDKLMAYLCRQGFSYDMVKRVVEETRQS